MQRRVEGSVVAALVVLGWAALAAGQDSASAAPAAELRALMARGQTTAAAAADPVTPGRFVAATYIEGLGLLVVAAKSSAAAYIQHTINNKQYSEAYTSLNGTAASAGKLFVQDMGADGLQAGPDKGTAFDIVDQEVSNRLLLNGDWKAQHLSEQEYQLRARAIDQEYARMLGLMVAQLKQGT